MSTIFLVFQTLCKEFLQSRCRRTFQWWVENLLWKLLTSDRLKPMILPARLLLAALALSIGCLTPIVSPQTTLTNSRTSDRCASVNTGRCHSCPMTTGETSSAFGSSCCATQSGCCALYLTRATTFSAGVQLIGTVGVNDERATTRTQRPPVPPPRGAFS
jgi:hypothetical protein